MNLNEMTETDQKCYMINTFANIKDAINAEGGNITDETPYDQYASSITAVTNIQSLSVTPTTSQQIITASGSVDGYSPITVSAVTSSIDSNITAENIKKDVTILGVTGSLESGGGSGGIDALIPYMYPNAESVGTIYVKRSGGEPTGEYYFTLSAQAFSSIVGLDIPEDYSGIGEETWYGEEGNPVSIQVSDCYPDVTTTGLQWTICATLWIYVGEYDGVTYYTWTVAVENLLYHNIVGAVALRMNVVYEDE